MSAASDEMVEWHGQQVKKVDLFKKMTAEDQANLLTALLVLRNSAADHYAKGVITDMQLAQTLIRLPEEAWNTITRQNREIELYRRRASKSVVAKIDKEMWGIK